MLAAKSLRFLPHLPTDLPLADRGFTESVRRVFTPCELAVIKAKKTTRF